MLQGAVTTTERSLSYLYDVQPATSAEIESAVATVTLAFSSDPVARWIYSDSGKYLSHFPRYIRAFAGQAFSNGTAYVTSDFSGAALWLEPGVKPDEAAMLHLFEASVTDEIKGDLFKVVKAMAAYHPDEPHWYLPMIGVDTSKQDAGIGSMLMAFALSRCDAEGLSAYLESSNPRNIRLYERFGFEQIGTIQYGNSAPLVPMLRKPR